MLRTSRVGCRNGESGRLAMASNRLELLNGILQKDPKNLLARYGLAMEYAQRGDYTNSVEHFRALIASNPNYVASYYQAGRVLQKIGEAQQAREVFEQGITACDRAGDLHARGELEAALAELSS